MHIIIGEQKLLQTRELPQFAKVGVADDVVKAHVLKRNLFHSFLELDVIEDFEGVAIDEEHGVAFNLSVARLDHALVALFLPPFVPVEAQSDDSFHFLFPFLGDYFQQVVRTDVVAVGGRHWVGRRDWFVRRHVCARVLLLLSRTACRNYLLGFSHLRSHLVQV